MRNFSHNNIKKMKRLQYMKSILLSVSLISCITSVALAQSISYPKAQQIFTVKDYHGIKITDPYQWMETVNTEPVQSWMKAQDKTINNFLDNETTNTLIKNSMNRFGKTGKGYSVPIKGGKYYFYRVQSPELNHPILYAKKGLDGKAELLLDMNKELVGEETFGGFSVCPNGNYIVLLIKEGQASYGKLRILNINKKEWYKEELTGAASPNIGWTYNNGFYYIYYGESETLNKKEASPHSIIKYHKINSPQNKDILVMEATKKKEEALMLFSISSAHDFQHLVVKTQQGRSDKNMLHLIDTKNHSKIALVEVMKDMFNYVGSKGNHFYFYTNKNASNGKIIAIDKENPNVSNWKTVIQERKEVLAGGSTAGGNAMNFIGDKFTLLYREGTHTQILVFDLKGKLEHTIPLETGWIGSGLVGRSDGNEAWFSLNTFLSPNNIYRLDLETGQAEIFFDRGLAISRDDYKVENTYYKSKDGTKVPIYICYKKDLKPDGKNPVFIYGYGFGGWVATPWYQPQMLTFLEMGGVYVLPGIRGGGEYGDAWRDAGIKLHRQNAIDDYISAAEFLIEQKLTSRGLLIANGWSASGSLAAAVTMQRPDLFGAALIGIPSLDMLRYEKYTAFKGWTSGYGSVENKEEFLNLFKWSPYHNIKTNTCYPPMLVTVGEKDPTTPPQHGYKFVAALQAHQRYDNPVLLKIVWGGGHGFGITNEQTVETKSQEIAFLVKVLDLDVEKLK